MAALAAVSGLAFFRTLLFGGVFASIDMVKVHVPFRTFIASSLASGQLPLWNPDVFLGAPFLANGDAALLYPLQFPFFLAGPAHGVAWVIWLHAVLSLLSMYALARVSLGAGPVAAFTAGVVFAFNGYALSHTLYLSTIYVAPWGPLLVLTVERAVNSRLAWAWLAPLPVAASVLAGNPQEIYWLALWLPVLCAALAFARGDARLAARGIAVSVAGGVAGLGVAAAQLLPQLQLVSAGSRGGGGFTYQQATLFPLARRVALTLPLPDYLHTFSGENAAWIGVVGLVLVLGAFARALKVASARPLVVFFAAMAAGSALFALGSFTPAYRLLYALIPGMHLFRFPVRWLYPESLAMAALVAIGTEHLAPRLLSVRGRGPLAWIAGAAILALLLLAPFDPLVSAWSDHRLLLASSVLAVIIAAGGLLLSARRAVLAPAAVLVPAAVFAELFAAGQFMEWNHPYPDTYYSAPPAIATAIRPAAAARILPLSSSMRWQDSIPRLGPNTNLLFGIPSAYGEGGNWPAGRSTELESQVVLAGIQAGATAGHQAELWRALGITHVVADSAHGLNPTAGVAEETTAAPWTLYGLAPPSPRAWISCGAVVEPSARSDLAAVLSPSFTASTLHVEASAAGSGTPHPCGSVVEFRRTPGHVRIVATAPAQAWLVVTQTYDSDWIGLVDGSRQTVVPADYFVQAIPIAAGTHAVRLDYSPHSVALGVLISLASMVLWLVSGAALLLRGLSASGRFRARGST